MDARDSSSVAVPSPRHGQMDDDGAALTVTCGLAKDAASLFQSGHYAECIEVLNQILQKKEDDPKVQMLAITSHELPIFRHRVCPSS